MTQTSYIRFSGVNPFDRSYHELEANFDQAIVNLLCDVLNASAVVISSPLITNLQRYERVPNAWVLEQITKGSAEISSTTVVLTPESEKAVQYSIAVGTFRPQLYLRQQSLRMAHNIYLLPFSVDVWITLCSILLTLTVVLTFILARETRLPHNTPYDIIARIADEKHDQGIDWKAIDVASTPEESLRDREHWEMSEIVLLVLGAMGQQGSERDPSTAGARTLLITLFILAVTVYTAYSASVISLISVLPNTDQEQMFGWKAVGNSQLLLQDTNFFRYSFDVPTKEVTYTTVEHGLKAAVCGKGAFIADRDHAISKFHLLGLPADDRCSLGRAYLGIEYQRVFAVRNGSKHLPAVNFNILRFRQYGLLSRERRRSFDLRQPCSLKDRASISGFTSIDIYDIKPAFQLLIWGWAVAIATIFVEYFLYQCSSHLKNTYGDSWQKKEDDAGKILNRWLRKTLYDRFHENRNLVEPVQQPRKTRKFLH